MAYTTTNPPQLAGWGPLTSQSTVIGARLWVYSSSDSAGTVTAANYFTNAGQLGLKIGDILFIYDSTNKQTNTSLILTVGSTTDTMSSGTVIGTTS